MLIENTRLYARTYIAYTKNKHTNTHTLQCVVKMAQNSCANGFLAYMHLVMYSVYTRGKLRS